MKFAKAFSIALLAGAVSFVGMAHAGKAPRLHRDVYDCVYTYRKTLTIVVCTNERTGDRTVFIYNTKPKE